MWKNKKETKCFWSHYWSHELPHRLKHCGILKTLLCGLQWWSSRWKSAQICTNLHKSEVCGVIWDTYTCGSLKDSLKLKSETVFVFLLVKFWNFFFLPCTWPAVHFLTHTQVMFEQVLFHPCAVLLTAANLFKPTSNATPISIYAPTSINISMLQVFAFKCLNLY